VSQYQKDKINLDFTEARDTEWQWHQLGHMQVRTLLQTDNHTSTPPLWAICKSAPFSTQTTTPAPHHCFLQAVCPSFRPTNSIKAQKAPLNYKIKG